ncbi:MAG TPA: hypothetical protein VGC80_14985 [Acetobacteraceae bacterium]
MAYPPAARIADSDMNLVRGLGWFSIVLGVLELTSPRRLARFLGMRGSAPLIAAYGLREISAGVSILASDDPESGVWSRVGGDLMDLGTLAAGFGRRDGRGINLSLALVIVAGATLVDLGCARALEARR